MWCEDDGVLARYGEELVGGSGRQDDFSSVSIAVVDSRSVMGERLAVGNRLRTRLGRC